MEIMNGLDFFVLMWDNEYQWVLRLMPNASETETVIDSLHCTSLFSTWFVLSSCTLRAFLVYFLRTCFVLVFFDAQYSLIPNCGGLNF